jgi:hypothetical protein
MRKLINIDRVKMKALGYSKAPIRQICMLNLSSEEMIVLLNFFSHKHNWDIGNIGISERNFYKEKNKKRVRQITNKLKTMGYLSETDTHYIVELENIQKDYEHNLKEVETRIAIKQRERAKTRKQKVNVSGVTQNNPSIEVEQMMNIMLTGVTQSNYKGVTQSNPQGVIESNPNKNNNNAGDAAPKAAAATSNNPTNEIRLDVGDCVSSAASSASQTSQTTHTPTVVGRNENIENDKLKDNTPINDLEFLIYNNIQFRDLYERNTAYDTANWYACDISKYTNDYIAYAVSERLKDTPIKDIPSNTYSLLYYMVKYSSKTPNSKLWQAFLTEIGNNEKIKSKIIN